MKFQCIGDKDKTYIWLGNPWWGGIALASGRNIHLQALLCCLGATPRIKFHWFIDAWKGLFRAIFRR